MTGEQVSGVVSTYAHNLGLAGVQPVENGQPLEHIHWMCLRIIDFVRAKDFAKADRWLGFVQGALWSQGVYSIPTMRTHNRSSDEQKSARAAAFRLLKATLDLAVWPGSDVNIASRHELLAVTLKQPDGSFHRYWLEVRAIKEVASLDAD